MKSYILSGNNVLQVLPLAHEYQSPLARDCEDFMIAMCTPGMGLTVSILLDYILAGEKYDLTRFIEIAVEFCARINFNHLNGTTIEEKYTSSKNYRNVHVHHVNLKETLQDQNISLKFSEIDLKIQFAIAKKRLKLLEMNTMKRKHSKTEVSDHSIKIS